MNKRNQVAKYYDRTWNKWDEMKIYGPVSKHSRRIILSLIGKIKFKNVLDIGCGTALLLSEIKEKNKGVRVFGTDISPLVLKVARWNIKDGKFLYNDISKEKVNIKADLVLCCDVLEHIKDYKKALKNIRYSCNKYFLLTTLQNRMRGFEKNVGHVRNFQKNELIKELNNTGFEVIKIIEWGFPFYSPIYRSLFFIKGVEAFTYGKYGLFKKIIASLIYYLFFLNLSRVGDTLILLCKIRESD